MNARRAWPEIDERAIGAGGDAVEARDLNIGRRPADAASEPCRSFGDREAFAPDLSRNVSESGEHQFFALHRYSFGGSSFDDSSSDSGRLNGAGLSRSQASMRRCAAGQIFSETFTTT